VEPQFSCVLTARSRPLAGWTRPARLRPHRLARPKVQPSSVPTLGGPIRRRLGAIFDPGQPRECPRHGRRCAEPSCGVRHRLEGGAFGRRFVRFAGSVYRLVGDHPNGVGCGGCRGTDRPGGVGESLGFATDACVDVDPRPADRCPPFGSPGRARLGVAADDRVLAGDTPPVGRRPAMDDHVLAREHACETPEHRVEVARYSGLCGGWEWPP